IGGYLVAIPAFGSYFARFQRTTRDYFLTGRSVPWWAICFTIVATETSSLTFISVPAPAQVHQRTADRLQQRHAVPPAGGRLRHRPSGGQRDLHPRVLPRRSDDLV